MKTRKTFNVLLDFLKENIEFISVVNTGEALSIADNTPLSIDPAHFGIKTLKNGRVYWDENRNWESEDGTNTHLVRVERLMRLREFLDSYQHIAWVSGKALKEGNSILLRSLLK